MRLFLGASVFPLVIMFCEVYTRALIPQNVDAKMDIFVQDPAIGFKYEPHATTFEMGKEYKALYEINSLGLRDREYGPKTEGLFRILLLGDSFSVSHGLPITDSLSRQMEHALQKIAYSDGKDVEIQVVNAAVGGYSPFNYLNAYRRWGQVFKPDVVLVGLSPDDYDCSNEQRSIGQGLRKTRISFRLIRKWLSWNSELYVLLRNFVYYSNVAERIMLWRKPGGLENDGQLALYLSSQREEVGRVWAKSFSYLDKLKQETAKDKVPLVLIPLPLKMEIDTEQFRQVLATKGLSRNQVDLSQQLSGIKSFANGLDITVLDPRPALYARQPIKRCYFVLDGHWNAEGIRVSSAFLAEQWRHLALPPWSSKKTTHANR